MASNTAAVAGFFMFGWLVCLVLAIALPPWGYTQIGPLTSGYGYFLNMKSTTATSETALKLFAKMCTLDSDCYIDTLSNSRCYCRGNMDAMYNTILSMPCANAPGRNQELADRYKSMMMAGRAILIIAAVLALLCTLIAWPARNHRDNAMALVGLGLLGLAFTAIGLGLGVSLFVRNFAVQACYGESGLDALHYGTYFHLCWVSMLLGALGVFMGIFLVSENRKRGIVINDTTPILTTAYIR